MVESLSKLCFLKKDVLLDVFCQSANSSQRQAVLQPVSQPVLVLSAFGSQGKLQGALGLWG